MSTKSRNRNRRTTNSAPAPRQNQTREQKRAQFTEKPASRWQLIAAAVVVGVAVIAAVAVVMTRGETAAAPPAAASTGGSVKIPLADLKGGEAKFYSHDVAGTTVNYFVMKSSDGEYRAAFDACDVCYASKKGYHQEGDEMVCNNCGRRFPSTQINVLEGGCNPSPLEREVKGKNLVIPTTELDAGVKYF